MTLIQLIDQLKTLAQSHPMIRTFGEGDIYDYVDNGGEINYPVLWVVQQNHTLSKNSITYQLQLIYADLLLEDKSNRLQSQSDQLQVAMDILSKLKLDNTYTFSISDNVSIETFQERFNDFATGVSMTISFVNPYPFNYCTFPTT
jgi:competence CoiA-like predicted nuclease